MVKIADILIPGASLQGLTASHSYWVSKGASAGSADPSTRVGLMTDTLSASGASLLAGTTVEPPGGAGTGWFDLSLYTAINIYWNCAAQTGSAALVLFLAELWPNEANTRANGVFVAIGTNAGAIITPGALAAGAQTNGIMNIGLGETNTYTPRVRRFAFALGATTWPTAGAPLSLAIWGAMDGSVPSRG